ncbi:MAG: lipopolysaccharide biosynthesis protein [Rikenellaceae bacterium]
MNSAKKNRNTSGVAWSAIERLGIQGSQFVASMILARMLVPADYGLIAMLTIFIALAATLVDSGMAQALIQRQNREESDSTTAFIFNVVVAIAIYGIIYISAPLIAQFYDSPELCAVARVYCVVIVINSLSVVQQAMITIELDFKRQAMASLTGVIVGGCVAIALAYNGWGVWALVVQQIVSETLRTIILWIIARWRPVGGFSWHSFGELSKFGSKLMASGLIQVTYVNLYPLIIGRHFAPNQLGLFNRATTIGALPSNSISTIVDRALYPVLCAEQADKEGAASTMSRYLGVVCFAVFPTMVGLAVLARPTILLLLGERWLGVVPLLQAISIAYMWDPIMKFTGSYVKSQGHSDRFLRAEIIKKIWGIGILVASIPFGIETMAWGLLLYALSDLSTIIYFARKSTPTLGYRSTARRLAPMILITALMGIAIHLVVSHPSIENLHPLLQLTICGAVGSTIYLLLSTITGRPELRQLREIARSYGVLTKQEPK